MALSLPPLPDLPEDADEAQIDAWMEEVKKRTVQTVALWLPLESARQALLACRQIDQNLGLTPEDERVAPLRDAIKRLAFQVEGRVNEIGQEDFVGVLVDSPDGKDTHRIYWLRLCLAATQHELAEAKKAVAPDRGQG